ncbi:MAG: hypothetical protein E6J35_07180 [Chloroflexi bacterium]|nr:MAG: hypothetical protein E6J35_07180 [Chloroflexota bacterium]TME86211.1 MAG: hypothetical protein E6I44_13980 [Chloroflexota bacterium]
MGASGAAFTTAIDVDAWDPIAAAPLDDATLERAARGTGMRADAVKPPFDEEMKALVVDRVLEALEAKVPPLARGLVGPSEYGLVVGCDEETPTFYARTYFDKTEQPTKLDWSAFEKDGLVVFLDRAGAPDRAAIARDAVEAAVASTGASDHALEIWIAALRDDARWTDTRHAGAAAFGDHAMRTLLADKRTAAASFLRTTRALFPGSPGADLLRAAESYGYVADAAKKVGIGAFGAAVAMRFLDAGHRRSWAKQLEAALGHERDAHDALRAARAGMR